MRGGDHTARQARLAFYSERRRLAHPRDLVRAPGTGSWECILVHPLGFQGVVDCYARARGDACFLQLVASRAAVCDHASYRTPCVRVRWNEWTPPLLNLLVVVDADVITCADLEGVMTRLLAIGWDACQRAARADGLLVEVADPGPQPPV